MLVTNSLKNDLNSSDHYTIGLALTALGNICSAEMARDLSPEVDALLSNADPFLRKKAALCARRMLQKVPDMIEPFAEKSLQLLHERNHAVVLTGVTLMTDIVAESEAYVPLFSQAVPLLCRILRVLVSGGFAAEYDVGGVSDPYLQVQVLRLLGTLGKDDDQASDEMGDVLAQVATNTDSNRPAANAVLYECVRTIMKIKSISGLKTLAVNTLGRFLGYKDNNMRYVALELLLAAVGDDPSSVQRHRAVIIECVKDNDDSIRKKALELVYALVNDGNAVNLINELLDYLKICEKAFKAQLTEKICMLIQKFLTNARSYIDAMLRVLVEAGDFVLEDACRALIIKILNSPDQHKYACEYFVSAWIDAEKNDEINNSLLQVALWVSGEYSGYLSSDENALDVGLSPADVSISEEELALMIVKIIENHMLSQVSREYALSALAKIDNRLKSKSAKDMVLKVLEKHGSCMALEEQTRSVEYARCLQNPIVSKNIFDHMPALEVNEEGELLSTEPIESDAVGGLDDGEVDLSKLLGLDISNIQENTSLEQVLDQSLSSSVPARSSQITFEAYKDGNIRVDFNVLEMNAGGADVEAQYFNVTTTALENFAVQAAVPKHMKLKLDLASAGHLSPMGSPDLPVTQGIHITRLSPEKGKHIVMRLRICYSKNGEDIVQVAEVSFPSL